ncbi:uncharacterized protein LOC113851075 [Abrus precatorius]|uniref:Uncharacterized protein LOC113851075 n=1 Tax=Abrus precatorius TaxID=3816 RepID=A0A8B8K2W5_ABRPR|nr:uncharacterized protein LOC113851075 [Abrus precatorius]
MANPTPIRPWSRLVSLRSIPPPQSEPKPQTLPSQLVEPPLKAPQTRNTYSQDNNFSATKSLPTTTTTVQSQTQSQNLKLTTPPTFSPSKLKPNTENETKKPVEEEPKTVLVNETIEKPNANGNDDNGSMQNGSQKQGTDHHEKHVTNKENETKWKGIDTKLLGCEGYGITRVITIAGENRGAYMEIIKPQKNPVNKMGYLGDGEVNANGKDKSQKVRTLSSLPKTGFYVNSNVQCINNSMVLHTSCTHHDPGVHLSLSKKPFGKRVDGHRN